MDWLRSFTIDQVQWGFIGITIFLAFLVWIIGRRRLEADSDQIALMMDWFEMRGIGTIYQLIVLLTMVGMAWVGWRLPAEFEKYLTEGSLHIAAFPEARSVVGRFAQVVGAFGFAAIALRSVRYIVPIGTFFLGVVAVYLAFQYIGYEF